MKWDRIDSWEQIRNKVDLRKPEDAGLSSSERVRSERDDGASAAHVHPQAVRARHGDTAPDFRPQR